MAFSTIFPHYCGQPNTDHFVLLWLVLRERSFINIRSAAMLLNLSSIPGCHLCFNTVFSMELHRPTKLFHYFQLGIRSGLWYINSNWSANFTWCICLIKKKQTKKHFKLKNNLSLHNIRVNLHGQLPTTFILGSTITTWKDWGWLQRASLTSQPLLKYFNLSNGHKCSLR